METPGWKRLVDRTLSDVGVPLVVYIGIPVLAVYYLTHRISPILPHYLAQLLNVAISTGVFMLTWNGRRFLDNHYFLFLGISCLFVGIIDGLHAMAFDGWIGRWGTSLDTRLWYAARYLLGGSLVVAPWFITRKIRPGNTLVSCFLAASALVAIFVYGVPMGWFRQQEHPWFVGVCDLVLFLLGVAGYAMLRRGREHFDREVYRRLSTAILFAVLSGASESMGMAGRGGFFLVGDLFMSLSFILFYKALIETGLARPYDLMYRNLKRSEEEARAARKGLEARVADRTAELVRVNDRLQQELAARKAAERERELMIDLLRMINGFGNIKDLIAGVTSFLKDRSGCESVWIRYRIGPEETELADRGFTADFPDSGFVVCPAGVGEAQGGASGRFPSATCLCGAFVPKAGETTDPAYPEEAAFWTNSVSSLLSGFDVSPGPDSRKRCCRKGFESLAIVPLRSGDATIGFLQLGDTRKGIFTREMIERYGRIADHVATAFARHMAKEALRESEDRFRMLVENVPAGILIVQEGRVVFGNPAVRGIFGEFAAPVLFRDFGQILPEDREKFERLCEEMERTEASGREMDLRFALPEGGGQRGLRWIYCQTGQIEYRGAAAILVVLNDLTRMKDLEQIVSTREKLSIIGQMAAGIAHEIRNPLSGININVSTLEHVVRNLEEVSAEERVRIEEIVAQAKAASDKIAVVIRRVMDFTKQAPPKLALVDMNQVVREALIFSSATLRKGGIAVEESIFPGLPRCYADPRLLEQVLLNLVTNAVEAMERVEGRKRLGVATSAEGGSIVVRVYDNGPGVPPHIRERIFDPFYTTRKSGHGIGLSFSRRVIENHGGTLTASEGSWGGAEFRITIPVEAERSPA